MLWFGSFRFEQGERRTLVATVLFTVAGVWWMRAQGLWLARVSAIRVVEITRITRAIAITAVTMFTFDRVVHFGLYVRQITHGDDPGVAARRSSGGRPTGPG